MDGSANMAPGLVTNVSRDPGRVSNLTSQLQSSFERLEDLENLLRNNCDRLLGSIPEPAKEPGGVVDPPNEFDRMQVLVNSLDERMTRCFDQAKRLNSI